MIYIGIFLLALNGYLAIHDSSLICAFAAGAVFQSIIERFRK